LGREKRLGPVTQQIRRSLPQQPKTNNRMKTNSISAGRSVHTRTTTTPRHLGFRRAWLWTGFQAFAAIAFGPQSAQAAVTEAWVQRYGSEAGCEDSAYKVVTDAAGNVIVAGTPMVIKYSGAGVPLWTNGFNGLARAMAVDGSGNVFVTGSWAGSGGVSDYATIAYSGGGVPLWTNRYNGPGNYDDLAIAIAVDGSGNVFVTGYSYGSGSSFDYATIAYSGAGVPLWTNSYNGLGNSSDQPIALAVDGSGNVFVTGYSRYPDANGNDYFNYATIAYSGMGVPLWTNRYKGSANGYLDQATAIAVDGSGNVFVTGTSIVGGSSFDYATIAYSGAGVPLWTNRYSGGGIYANAVAVDRSGNVFVTGSVGDYATIAYSGAGVALWTNRYGGRGEASDVASAVVVDASGKAFVTGYSFGTPGYEDYATIAYSGGGVPLWTNRYNGPGNSSDQAIAMAVDASGNVFVTGSSTGSGGNSDYATIGYSGAGVPLWTNRFTGQPSAMAVDASAHVFVTGSSTDSGGNSDYATIGYSGAGVPLWTNRYGGPGNSSDQAIAIAVDGSGNVFVTGSSGYRCTDLGCGGGGYGTIAYSGAGVPLWTNRYAGPANSDQPSAAAVDGSGNVFVTGSSYGGSGYDYATVAYSSAGVPLWTNRYNGPANGTDSPQTKPCLAIGSDGAVYVTGTADGLFLSDFLTVKHVWRTEIGIQLLPTVPPKVNLTLSAAPNSTWAIERAPEFTGPWTNLSPLLIGTNGSAQFQDTNSPYPVGYYRARLQ
jgi:hypothetical protein